jgi:hypothetical protein
MTPTKKNQVVLSIRGALIMIASVGTRRLQQQIPTISKHQVLELCSRIFFIFNQPSTQHLIFQLMAQNFMMESLQRNDATGAITSTSPLLNCSNTTPLQLLPQ